MFKWSRAKVVSRLGHALDQCLASMAVITLLLDAHGLVLLSIDGSTLALRAPPTLATCTLVDNTPVPVSVEGVAGTTPLALAAALTLLSSKHKHKHKKNKDSDVVKFDVTK